MASLKATTVRLSATQRAQLNQLARKLQIDTTNVIRLAIARLAEAEGITHPDKGK